MLLKCIILLGITCVIPVSSKRILIIPLATHSHIQCFTGFGAQLVHRGHEVYMLFNAEYDEPKAVTDGGMKVVTYKCGASYPRCGTIDDMQTKLIQTALKQKSIFALYKEVQGVIHEEIISILQDEELFTELNLLQFDIVILDGLIVFRPAVLVPHRLGTPTITLSDFEFDSVLHSRLPQSAAYVPSQMTTFTENMNLFERTVNFLLNYVFYFYQVADPLPDDIIMEYQQYGKFRSIADLTEKTLLWLRTTDEVLDFNRPRLPNTINIGGLSTGPAKTLNPQFQNFADKSINGLILVSFGSMAYSLPDEIAIKFLDVFANMNQQIIWRFQNKNSLHIPENVMLSKWMPQQSLLAHPNAKVFITHSGNNGQFEALYFAVPMIGFALLGDQHYNCKRIDYKKFGICMDLFTFTSDELTANLNKLITQPIFSDTIGNASAIFRSRKSTPVERATDMIEHVLTFGGDHLRPYSLQMPLYQYLMIDVIILILYVIAFVLLIIFICLRLVYRKCCSSKQKIE